MPAHPKARQAVTVLCVDNSKPFVKQLYDVPIETSQIRYVSTGSLHPFTQSVCAHAF